MATTEGAQAPEAKENLAAPVERNSILVEPKAKEPANEPETPEWQKTIDRMGNELGELRKANRDLEQQLQVQFDAMNVGQEPEAPSFESDPEAFIQHAVQKAIEGQLAPKLQVLESDLLNRQSVKFDESLSETYPDWKETVKTSEFADWVQASPARGQMYQIADQQFDVASAVELIKRYKQDAAEAEANKQGAIAAAGLVQGGGDSGGARTYAASEIRQMMSDNPESYRRWLANDGMKAYQEGRVNQNA